MDFSSLNPLTSNALNLAARNNEYKTVKRLLKKRNPNYVDNRGWTCLHEAAANDSYESLCLILKHPDCRPLAETHEGHTALYLACRHLCSVLTVRELLQSVEDIANYGSTEDVTPLHVASSQGQIDIIQLLIEYGAIINVQDFDGDTPLHDAALASQHEAVSILLHAGADPEIKNESNLTPFHLACHKGCIETMKKMFPFISDINQVTMNGDGPLALATQGCNDEMIQFLLENGADPHIKNVHGDVALTIALNRGHASIFQSLLLVTDKDKIDPNIILNACKPHYFKFEILESLLNYDLGPEFFDFVETFYVLLEQLGTYKPVYLTNAPLNSYLNICEYIYNNSPDKFREFFYLFLTRGLAVDAVDINECPPLVYIHYCMHTSCFKEVFEILQSHGCNVDYCTTCVDKQNCIPDVFLASLTADPSTSLVMLPYSLYCEPGSLLQFSYENNILGRIPLRVQEGLLAMIGVISQEITADSLHCTVLPLKHLCRVRIRKMMRERKGGVKSTTHFLEILNVLHIPYILKKYLCYQ